MTSTASDQATSRIPLGEGKVTGGMRSALEGLMNALQCPLCNELFKRPTTLASCGHSFCEECIDDYNCNESICPVPGCGMPMSIVGGRRGSFRNINPQLAQSIESLQKLCHGLNRAPDLWWENKNLVIKPVSLSKEESGDFFDDHNNENNDDMEHQSDSDEENLIDLQKQCKKDDEDDDDTDWER